MSSFKIKYEEILENVTKFNKEKEILNNLLSYQKMSNNHFDLEFSNNNFGKSTHFYKKNNHNPYSSFVKINTDTISKRIRNKYIWIPKNLNNVDKNAYIAPYIHNVCNSCDYVYTNK